MSESWSVFVHPQALRSDPLFRVHHFARGHRYRGFVQPEIDRDGWFLLLTHSDIRVHRKDADMRLAAGNAMAMRYDRLLRYGGDGEWNRSYLRLGGSEITALIKRSGIPLFTPIPMKIEAFARFLGILRREVLEENEPERAIVRLCVTGTLEELRRASAPRAPLPRGYEALSVAERFLREHYREAFSLEALARSTGYATPYFASRFKETFGLPPLEYAIRLRMEEAADLLRQNALPIAEIARMVGYDNALYFSRVFHRHQGRSPRDWRKMKQAKSARGRGGAG